MDRVDTTAGFLLFPNKVSPHAEFLRPAYERIQTINDSACSTVCSYLRILGEL